MTQPTSEPAEVQTRQELEAEWADARERSLKADFLGQFEPESPEVTAQERRLTKDARDLSDAAISNALWLGGADPAQGLAGVPQDRAFAVSALLRSSERTNFTT